MDVNQSAITMHYLEKRKFLHFQTLAYASSMKNHLMRLKFQLFPYNSELLPLHEVLLHSHPYANDLLGFFGIVLSHIKG